MNLDFTRLIMPEARAAAALAERREAMVCSRLQGRLVLGQDVVARLDAIAADPAESWGLRETIANATEWHRNSHTLQSDFSTEDCAQNRFTDFHFRHTISSMDGVRQTLQLATHPASSGSLATRGFIKRSGNVAFPEFSVGR